MTGIYREPDPLMGPDRASDAYPLTDGAEVRALRQFGIERDGVPVPFIEETWIALGPEQYRSHEEYMAARDLEQWGYNPFTEYEE